MKKSLRGKARRGRRPEGARSQRVPPERAPVEQIEETIQIEKPIYGGSFLARVEGKAVFVPLVLPGETARVHVTEQKRSYATAELDQLVTEAAERITPGCRHFGTCGGCQYQHAGYATQLDLKRAILRETLERGGVRVADEIAVLAAADDARSWGYRNRIRVAFDPEGRAGYRGRRSNAVVAIAECPIAAPLLVRAALAFAEVARDHAAAFEVTEFSLFCDAEETALLASVFVAKGREEHFDEFARACARRIPELKGAEMALAERDGDREPALQPVATWGESFLVYRAAGFAYRVDHGAFFQVNRWLVNALVDRVAADQQGELAWDLFAGVGLFARRLTESFARVVAVESAPSAVRSLEENLRGTSGQAVRATTRDFLRGSSKAERPDLIVVDPPRAGVGGEIAERLSEIGAPALTYVSCDPATLARDLRILLDRGYAIESITLTDLFPQTFHLETVARLRRA